MQGGEAQFHRVRDHYSYALWVALFANLWLVVLDQRFVAMVDSQATLGALRESLRYGKVLPVLCLGYLVFRLVRPFPFLTEARDPPDNFVHYVATLLLTLGAVLCAASLAWAAGGPAIVGYREYLEIVLPGVTLAGFLAVETALVRKLDPIAAVPPYLDAGLLSATLMAPALIAWFLLALPGAGLARAIVGFISKPGALPLFACYLSLATFMLWWLGAALRRALSHSPAWRAALAASWVYGIAAYWVVMVVRNAHGHYLARPDPMWTTLAATAERHAQVLAWTTAAWVALSLVLYAVARARPARDPA